jgi:hypothetical protein
MQLVVCQQLNMALHSLQHLLVAVSCCTTMRYHVHCDTLLHQVVVHLNHTKACVELLST